jgi:hypothetical protein
VIAAKDKQHIWQAPMRRNLEVVIEFPNTVRLAMIRVWNYNPSRIYWERGVKILQVFVDSRMVRHFENDKISDFPWCG